MVHDYHIMSMASFLFKLQDVTFCNKKTFPLLNNVVYTLLYKKVFYLWAKIKLFIWQWNYS